MPRCAPVIIGPVIVLALLAAGCGGEGASVRQEERAVRYVALGDSYTIGTGVAPIERWPNQLVERLGGRLELVANLGVNGATSADLLREQLPRLDELRPGFVSVLIGVNDVVRGVSDANYERNVAIILGELLGRVGAERVVCVATPDYTLTPRGGDFGDREERRAGIQRKNAILRSSCEVRGMAFVPDIFELSARVADDPPLVADDGLHPSGAQYRLWSEVIAAVAGDLLRDGLD